MKTYSYYVIKSWKEFMNGVASITIIEHKRNIKPIEMRVPITASVRNSWQKVGKIISISCEKTTEQAQ